MKDCFLKLKETIKNAPSISKKQNNYAWTTQLTKHSSQYFISIYPHLSHTHIRTCSSVTSLLHCTPISPIRRKHSHPAQQFSPCLPSFNIQTAKSGISSKHFLVETWVAVVSGQGYIQGLKYALNTFQDIWNGQQPKLIRIRTHDTHVHTRINWRISSVDPLSTRTINVAERSLR